MRKRFFAALLSFVMIFSLLPTSVLAANSNANDKIKITVRVFDPVTGGTWVVGEDTCQKADKYVQSVEYKIPALSKFVKNNTQTVQKVVGNWYFPAGDRWVGATVEWSNNASNVTMTYWVNNFKFAGDDGGYVHVQKFACNCAGFQTAVVGCAASQKIDAFEFFYLF